MRQKRILTLATMLIAFLLATFSFGAQSAQAADNDRLSATRSGVSAGLTVDWTGPNSFVLRNAQLKDTACDSQSVFFYVAVPGFRYPNHFNRAGCGTVTNFGPLRGSMSGNIYSLQLHACRDTIFEECAGSRLSDNPFVF